MNRRNFIKNITAATAVTTPLPLTLFGEEPVGTQTGTTISPWANCDYRGYCYERGQGEWTFSQNIRGSFAYQREYMTLEEDQGWPYAGWMDQGKLHFVTLDDATDFVDMHVRTKDDVNLIDSIYDVYFVNKEGTEINVAHFWFNGDTGRQVSWQSKQPYQDWSKMECS